MLSMTLRLVVRGLGASAAAAATTRANARMV
jgi:hypothetical protein